MNDRMNAGSEALEIDLQRVAAAVWKKKISLVLISIACALLTLAGTMFLVKPQYESSAMFYVNNNSLSIGGDTSVSISSGDLVASRNLVNTYVVILKTRETLNMVIDYAGVNRTYKEVLEMISAEAVDETEIFRVTVVSPDPAEAKNIADAIAYILPNRIKTIINGSYGEVVDNAVASLTPCSPNYATNTIFGLIIGFVVTLIVVVMMEILSVAIRSQEDIQYVCDYPILTTVPDMETAPEKEYQGKYAKKNPNAPKTGREDTVLVGANVSFAALEAYKLLRTKLLFSFPEGNGCRVIGVSSALSGEGKSLTAINLSYALSQLDKKVLLIDCDMRCPTLASRLPVKRIGGLSSYLSGQSEFDTLIQTCSLGEDQASFDVAVAGRNPPNPVELLSSNRMGALIAQVRQQYDYVVMDFPPVGEVSDALTASKLADGMLLVVRQGLCNRLALGSTVRQLADVSFKVVGIVFNGGDDHSQGYRYGKSKHGMYTTRYKRSYMAAMHRSAKAAAVKAAEEPSGAQAQEAAGDKEA